FVIARNLCRVRTRSLWASLEYGRVFGILGVCGHLDFGIWNLVFFGAGAQRAGPSRANSAALSAPKSGPRFTRCDHGRRRREYADRFRCHAQPAPRTAAAKKQ